MNNNSIETYETKFDLHTHHYRCNHALGAIRDYIESAINQGFHIIGISDHTPHFYGNKDQIFPGITMKISEFPLYIEEVLKLKKEYEGKIDVLLGVESDFFPQHIKVYEHQLKQYPFDYIIGSVHFVDNISIFDKRRWEGLTELEKVKTKESYFDLIQQAAKCGLFQIIGHLDAMKGMYPEFSKIETDIVEETLKIIGEHQLTIEINTSGKTKECGGWYPDSDILEKALFYNVDVTFGSDAHSPDRVGDDFALVQNHLREIGYKEWCYFKEKEKVICPI